MAGRAAGVVLIVMFAAACAKERQPPLQSEALERSARLLAKLDQLESDLHAQSAELLVNAELQERHGTATQLACQVTDDHIKEIHRLAAAQERKQHERALQRRAVAMARRAPRHGKTSVAAN